MVLLQGYLDRLHARKEVNAVASNQNLGPELKNGEARVIKPLLPSEGNTAVPQPISFSPIWSLPQLSNIHSPPFES